jgi:tRNA (cmo5U34)-methyltransferase
MLTISMRAGKDRRRSCLALILLLVARHGRYIADSGLYAYREDMKRQAENYYTDLQEDYATKIRKLVPKYDEMVKCILDLLDLYSPRTVLDIGCGIGNVTELVLERISGARVTAVEACESMAAEARRRLAEQGERVEIFRTDIVDFVPPAPFDAIISNLVLHNVPFDDKRRLLERLRNWLEPGGCFIWGEMILHLNERLQAHFVEYRNRFALDRGCSADLVEWNVSKEAEVDYPLTLEQTLEECRKAGFSLPAVVWAHDVFAIFLLVP